MIDCVIIRFEINGLPSHKMITMIRLSASAFFLLYTFFLQTDSFSGAFIWDKIEKFGLPTVLLLIIVRIAYNQNEKRMEEQREFWADNNRYLRELLREAKAGNSCKFEK